MDTRDVDHYCSSALPRTPPGLIQDGMSSEHPSSGRTPPAFKALLCGCGTLAGLAFISGGLYALRETHDVFSVAVTVGFGPLLGIGLIRGSWKYFRGGY